MATRSQSLLTVSAKLKMDEILNIYGRRSFKTIISAGVMVFDRLSAEERQAAIAEANGMNIDEPGVEQLKAGLKFANKAGFSETINILDADEREAVRQLRKALGPAAKHGKTKGEKTG